MARFLRGFSMIELLIVVAIIMILVAIAVPNFMNAQIRARVAAVQADMNTLVKGLEQYFIEHQAYPPRHAPLDHWGMPVSVMPPKTTIIDDLKRLTTPIDYLDYLVEDKLNQNTAPPYNLLEYWDDIQCKKAFVYEVYQGQWAIVSTGPDGTIGCPTSLVTGGDYPDEPYPNTWRHIYDPTNGARSIGNIWYFKKNRNPETHIYQVPAHSF